jgi:hypothetical protein
MTTSTSRRPISGRISSIWKLRDSVATAPIRSVRRASPSRPFKVFNSSSPDLKTVFA